MTGIFVSACDPEWRHCLGQLRHDIYDTPEYGLCCGRHERALPVAYIADIDDTRFLIPLLARGLPGDLQPERGLRDLASPYGYPGILSSRPASAHTVSRLLHQFVAAARIRGFVSAFIRLHPLLTTSEPAASPDWVLVRHGQTVYIDLTQSEEEIWSDTRLNHRRQIRNLQNLGFHAVLNRWDLMPAFASMYRSRMAELRADEYYMFSDAYFNDLRSSLGERLLYCTILTRCGQPACGGLFTLCGDIIQYHLGAYSRSFVVAPSKLMFHSMARWGRNHGYKVLHLGGGLGARADDLFRFKAGFSSLRAHFDTLRVVCDQRAYAELVSRKRNSRSGAVDCNPDFFPHYRNDK